MDDFFKGGTVLKIVQPHTIMSAEIRGGKLEIVRKYPSNMMLMSMPPKPAPDRVIKEIYSAVDGVIALTETIEGSHRPAYNVAESIEFPAAHTSAGEAEA